MKVEVALAPLCSQINGLKKWENVFCVPMETISDGAVKMHCCELYGCDWGGHNGKEDRGSR